MRSKECTLGVNYTNSVRVWSVKHTYNFLGNIPDVYDESVITPLQCGLHNQPTPGNVSLIVAIFCCLVHTISNSQNCYSIAAMFLLLFEYNMWGAATLWFPAWFPGRALVCGDGVDFWDRLSSTWRRITTLGRLLSPESTRDYMIQQVNMLSDEELQQKIIWSTSPSLPA